jgi:hypothetical protein
MRVGAALGLTIAAGLLLVPGASAQRTGEITLYSNIGFSGRAYTVTGPRTNITLGWAVRSVRVRGGGAWDLCTRTSYRAPCNRVTQNIGNIRWTVASARPVETAVPLPTPAPGGQSLRGMSAEFFVAPSDARGRVESCRAGTAACAAQSADRFCRSRGWTAASYERQQTVAGRNYLADVLCTRTG